MYGKKFKSKAEQFTDKLNDDYEASLIRKREHLQEQLDMFRQKASKEMGDAGFWGIIGGGAMMADWVLLGGFGTAVAVISTALWANARMDTGKLQKQLKEVEDNLLRYQEMKLRLKPPAPEPKLLPSSIKNDFDENAALKKRLAELERQMAEIQNPKPVRLDKNPTPKPPSPYSDG